jgi:PAS domain-containing protein
MTSHGSPPTGALPGRASARLQAELDTARSELKSCKESHERNLRALCAIADGIAIVDTQGRITCLNPVASHLTGWKESD